MRRARSSSGMGVRHALGATETGSSCAQAISRANAGKRLNLRTFTSCLTGHSLRTPTTFVDADACPVKEEIYRVARRTGCPVQVVANAFMRVPPDVTLTV